MTGTPLRIAARDGYSLAASHYAPEPAPRGAATAGRGLVLIAPATGVVRRLYDPFASFLAGSGYSALTWDWRGTGESRPPRLRGFRATMSEWGELDFGGVLSWARERAGEAPLLAVGHSFGGQALGLVPGGESIRAAVTVAAQSGWFGHWPRPRRYRYAALWYVVVPVLTTAFGYMPSRRLGFGEDLPLGVGREWARWCRSPRYLGDYRGHRRFHAPILALSFADDDYAPRRAVEALHGEYGGPVEHRFVAPAEAGVERIGHFGFFKPGLPALWAEAAAWLARAEAGSGHG